MEWCGRDMHGHPSLFIQSHHADLTIPRQERLQYLIVTLEKGISLMSPEYSGCSGVEQWNMIVDETKKTSAHMDNTFLSQVSPILTSHYAERLNRCYVINPSFLTQMVLVCIRFFVDDRSRSKIVPVYAPAKKNNQNRMCCERLLEEIGKDQVPEMYGGLMKVRGLEEYSELFHCIKPVLKEE